MADWPDSTHQPCPSTPLTLRPPKDGFVVPAESEPEFESLNAVGEPLMWFEAEADQASTTTPARGEAGFYRESLHRGDVSPDLGSLARPDLGARRHELRIAHGGVMWRISYRVDLDAMLLAALEARVTACTAASPGLAAKTTANDPAAE